MASTIPVQERIVDPFASYNSNVVNRITEIVTQNDEGMLITNSLQVISDSTSPNDTVLVKPGYAVKDDVLINITAQHSVNITDLSQYVSTTTFFPGAGYYYIVLEYQYQKQRPAPVAYIKILKPTERGLLVEGSPYLLLKVLDVNISGTILALYDSDPDPMYSTNERTYLRHYAGAVTNLPTFDQDRDQGRIAYESDRNKFYFGYESEWGELLPESVQIPIDLDTTGVSVGDICYVNSGGTASLASAAAINSSADFIITTINSDLITGFGIISGYAEGINVETAITISVGDKLYLSETDAGKVTNVKSAPYFQSVGRAVSAGNDTTPINIIFSPRSILSETGVRISGQISSWSGVAGSYYYDIDTSELAADAFMCSWFDDSTKYQVVPQDVEIRDSGDTLRVYFNINTLTINYIVQN